VKTMVAFRYKSRRRRKWKMMYLPFMDKTHINRFIRRMARHGVEIKVFTKF